MKNIIQFRKPQKQSLEDQFIETLNGSQTEMFYEIIARIAAEYENLENKFVKKTAECELLRIENERLNGGKNGIEVRCSNKE